MDSCLVLTECFSRRILRLRTSAIDLIHSERVSTSTSSFFAHRLAYSSHASMIMLKANHMSNVICSRFSPAYGFVCKKNFAKESIFFSEEIPGYYYA